MDSNPTLAFGLKINHSTIRPTHIPREGIGCK